MPNKIIEVKNLVKKYGDFSAVDDISFEVEEGDFFGFLGPNGAGKTTAIRVMATLLKKTSGAVKVAGYDVDREPNGVRHSIGFAMQDISLDNLASGYENLQLLGVLYGLSPLESRRRASELLELVGLSNVGNNWVNSYSGGMRRRLDLAGVLMHSPRLLFLDEPTQGLDPQARRVIWDYLQKLNQEGSTIFLTTHYMDEADTLCRNLAFIDHGKLVHQGTPTELKTKMGGDLLSVRLDPESSLEKAEEVIRQAAGHKSEISRDDHQLHLTIKQAGLIAPRIITALHAAKLEPVSISISEPSLEDVFVKFVGHSLLEEDNKLIKGHDPFIEGRK